MGGGIQGELFLSMKEGTTMREKVTVPAIQARKCGPKIKMVTAYDAPSARIADRAGADIILVGDTLAHVVLGYDDTLPATVE
jgi:3-methyl-2-oxobutanoate hydroxymethyltransferase